MPIEDRACKLSTPLLNLMTQEHPGRPGRRAGGSADFEIARPLERDSRVLIRRGKTLEWLTLGWNVLGVGVLAILAVSSASVALVGFGLDSLIEIAASTVVLWELSGTGEARQRRALRMIGIAFIALAVYLIVQSTLALLTSHHASPSIAGIAWTAVTALVMFALAAGKARTGRALGNPVLVTEGRVTFIDGLLAVAVLAGLALDLMLGWWWADPLAGYVIVYYAVREAVHIFRPEAS
jgi:divalent metal cation (Fe/Co/Zn/Cd) transporter